MHLRRKGKSTRSSAEGLKNILYASLQQQRGGLGRLTGGPELAFYDGESKTDQQLTRFFSRRPSSPSLH